MEDVKKWTMDMTEKDLKKLRFQKGMSLFMVIMMWIVVTMMVGFGLMFVIADGDDMAGKILAGGSIVILLLTLWIQRHYKRLKADYKGGVKEAVQGAIESKMRHKSNCDFTIDGQTYHVNLDAYFAYKKGDQVLISYGPASKVMLDISAVKPENK